MKFQLVMDQSWLVCGGWLSHLTLVMVSGFHHINPPWSQYHWPDPPWAAATFLGMYWGFGCRPLEPSTPSQSPLSFLQGGFLRGYEPVLVAVYWGWAVGFLTILRCSRASAAAAAPQLLKRNTEPTTFPGLAAPASRTGYNHSNWSIIIKGQPNNDNL